MFLPFAVRVTTLHSATYMRPFDSPLVRLGPFLQPLRGLLFAIGVWPLRRFLLDEKHGWLILWNIFIVFGILSTPAAAPCFIEGMLYTRLPLRYHLLGLPEIALQTLAFSAALLWWDRRPMHTVDSPMGPRKPFDFARALVTACLAWAGYALGGLLSVAVVRLSGTETHVNISRASTDVGIPMMFVVAFAVNLITVFFTRRRLATRSVSLWPIFFGFWALETLAPWLYQLNFTHPSRVHLALLLGFFPALIIAVMVRPNYRRVPVNR